MALLEVNDLRTYFYTREGVVQAVDGVSFEGRDLTKLSEKQLQDVRGRKIAMIFQDPMTSLNPTFKISTQITETLHRHFDMPKEEARKRAINLLDEVRIPRA